VIDFNTGMTLQALVDIWVERRRPGKATVRHYIYVVKRFSEVLGHEATAEDLNAKAINGFIATRRLTCAAHTLKYGRNVLMAMWHLAAELGLADYPCGVPVIQSYDPPLNPECSAPPKFRHESAAQALEAYLLVHDLRRTTEDSYKRVMSTLSTWAADIPERAAFNATVCSEFLRDKQVAGASTYYLRSMRAALRAILNFAGDTGRLRKVKVVPLSIEVWSETEVAKLVIAVPAAIFPMDDSMEALARRFFWSMIIPAAWYTGLSQGDLFRMDISHVGTDGRVCMHRNRSGKRVITYMPPELLARVDSTDGQPFFRPPVGEEHFRVEFAKIVKAAGLVGTFKKLRKSSGSRAEQLNAGSGHVHLGNSRRVFEQHYLGSDAIDVQPVRLPQIITTLPDKHGDAPLPPEPSARRGIGERLKRALGLGRKGGAT
jgi:hypothetical protein